MVTMPEEWRLALEALVKGPIAWQGPEELARSLGQPVEATTDLLADLDAAGWLEVWERDGDLVVTLSALGAERLGVRLVEIGASLRPRWLAKGDPEPPPPKARRVCSRDGSADLEFLADPSPTPEVAAEIAESAGGPPVRGRDRDAKAIPPRPRILLGEGHTPWPGPAFSGGTDGRGRPLCPVCRNRRLDPVAYCLRCDRWGLDGRETGQALRAGEFNAPGRNKLPSLAAARRAELRFRDARARRKASRKGRSATSPNAAPAPAALAKGRPAGRDDRPGRRPVASPTF